MRNVAIPLKERKAAEHRAFMRGVYNAMKTIPAAAKAEKLASIEKQRDDVAQKFADARADLLKSADARAQALAPEDVSGLAAIVEETRKIIAAATAETETIIADLERQFYETQGQVTDEEKEEAVTLLSEQDANFSRLYGPQAFTEEDLKQRNADTIERDEYIRERKYRDDRARAYPDITEQLDAIMKWVFSMQDQVAFTDELKSVAARCMQVKSEFPKPKG